MPIVFSPSVHQYGLIVWESCSAFLVNQRWAVWFKNKTLVIVSATLSLVPAGTSSSWDLAGGRRWFSHTVGSGSTASRSSPPRGCTPIACCIYAINSTAEQQYYNAVMCSGKTRPLCFYITILCCAINNAINIYFSVGSNVYVYCITCSVLQGSVLGPKSFSQSVNPSIGRSVSQSVF